MLGPELGKIAWEKAGIIKRGRPAVVARQPEEALEAIEREADDRMAPLFLMGRDFDAWEERGRLMVQMPDRLLDLPAAQPVRRLPVRQRRPGGGRGADLQPRPRARTTWAAASPPPSGRRGSSA